MVQSTVLAAKPAADANRDALQFNAIVAAIFLFLFALVIKQFQYHGAMAESDLYRVLVGLLDGQDSGKFLNTNLHYDREFGFGFLWGFYKFADPVVLRDPDRLMELINQVGFWCMLPGLAFLWGAISLSHGIRVATPALIVFALGPIIPEMATSGHQTIPMLMLICAAGILQFLPVRGSRAVLTGVGVCVLLVLSLLMRGESFLAYPWLVLTRIDTRSVRRFFLSGIRWSLAPASALLVFMVLQRTVIHPQMGSVVLAYFTQFYSWATVLPGTIYMMVGCGIATTIAAAVAAVFMLIRLARGASAQDPMAWSRFLGPVALVLVPFAFFVPNAIPPRHFVLTLAGYSILIGMALTSWRIRHPWIPLVCALLLGGANQVLAEAVRPALLRRNDAQTAYLPIEESYRTATHANLGWEWKRHQALLERRDRWHAVGEMIRTSCDPYTLVISDEGEQLFSRLYAGGVQVQARRVRIGDMDGLLGVRNGKTVMILDTMHNWPRDSIADVLADPALAQYKLFSDPYTRTIYARTPIPADRAARFGCPG